MIQCCFNTSCLLGTYFFTHFLHERLHPQGLPGQGTCNYNDDDDDDDDDDDNDDNDDDNDDDDNDDDDNNDDDNDDDNKNNNNNPKTNIKLLHLTLQQFMNNITPILCCTRTYCFLLHNATVN